jgi:hypothetical protein
VSSTDEDRKITEEEAENAEIISCKSFYVFGFPRRVEKGAEFTHTLWALSLWLFLPPRALRPLRFSPVFS